MADQDEHVNIIVSVDDKASKPLRDINASIKGTKEEARGFSSDVLAPIAQGAEKFAVSIGIPSKAIDSLSEAFHKAKAPVGDLALAVKGMAQTAVSDMGGFAKTTGIVVDTVGILTASLRIATITAVGLGTAIAAIAKSMSGAGEDTKELKFLSEEVHLSQERIALWTRAAERAGVAPEQFAGSLRTLHGAMREIAEDTPAGLEFLNKLKSHPGFVDATERIKAAAKQAFKTGDDTIFYDTLKAEIDKVPDIFEKKSILKDVGIVDPKAQKSWIELSENVKKVVPPVLPSENLITRLEELQGFGERLQNLRQRVLNALASMPEAGWMEDINKFLDKNQGPIGENILTFLHGVAAELKSIVDSWLVISPSLGAISDFLGKAGMGPSGREPKPGPAPTEGGLPGVSWLRDLFGLKPGEILPLSSVLKGASVIGAGVPGFGLAGALGKNVDETRLGKWWMTPSFPTKTEPTSTEESQPPPVQQTLPTRPPAGTAPITLPQNAPAAVAPEQPATTTSRTLSAILSAFPLTAPLMLGQKVISSAGAGELESASPPTEQPATKAAEPPATFAERFGALPTAPLNTLGEEALRASAALAKLSETVPPATVAAPAATTPPPAGAGAFFMMTQAKQEQQNLIIVQQTDAMKELTTALMLGTRTREIRVPTVSWPGDEPSWPGPDEDGRHGPGDEPTPPVPGGTPPTPSGPGDEPESAAYSEKWKKFPKSSNIEDRRKFGPFNPIPSPPDPGKWWDDATKAELKEGEARRQRTVAGQSTGFDKLSEGVDKFLRGIMPPAGGVAPQGFMEQPYKTDANVSKLPLDMPRIDDRSLAQLLETSLSAHAGTTRVEGSAKLTVDVNAPRGTLVKANTGGDLFKEVELNRSSQMAIASDWD